MVATGQSRSCTLLNGVDGERHLARRLVLAGSRYGHAVRARRPPPQRLRERCRDRFVRREPFAARARAVAGEGEAFGVIFDVHKAAVRRQVARFLVTPQDIEDAVAIVFFEAWRRRSALRLVDGSALPWLLVTGANVARNVRRSAARYRALLAELPDPVGRLDAVGYEEHDVLIALRSLALTDQQILTLCVLEGWSERDAAAALNVRLGTVKSRLHRAKRRLADQFTVLTQIPPEGLPSGS
jgi:RNA polymerase sigma factor (sigma-70 family)